MPAELFNSEQKSEFRAILSEMTTLYEAMKLIHKNNEKNIFANGAHALDHDLAVAVFAHAIGRRYSESLAITALAAALVHSFDRHPRSFDGPETYGEKDVRAWVEMYLTQFTQEERDAVVEAVLVHDKPNYGKVTARPSTGDILADADKLANIMVYSIIRLGQFAAQKPPVRLGNLHGRTPDATYKNFNVVLDDAYSRLEWLDDLSWFVTPEAKQAANILDKPLRGFVNDVVTQFREIGLDELPL